MKGSWQFAIFLVWISTVAMPGGTARSEAPLVRSLQTVRRYL
jgi:hypothetical protein